MKKKSWKMKRGEGKKRVKRRGRIRWRRRGGGRMKNRVSWDNDLVPGKPHKIKDFWVLTTSPVWWLELRSGDIKTIWDMIKTIFNYRKCIFHIVIFETKSDIQPLTRVHKRSFFAYNRKKKVFEKNCNFSIDKNDRQWYYTGVRWTRAQTWNIEPVGIAVIWFGQWKK